MKTIAWSNRGCLLGAIIGFVGFHFVASVFFPAENEVDSMILVIPFLLGSVVTAIIGGWFAGRLWGRLKAVSRRGQKQAEAPVDPSTADPS